MKTILTTLLSAALSGAAFAQVPSLINYQGRLTDATGAPVTGSKTFAISIYDDATAGNLLYTETIGAVTLDKNGVYSFQFGAAGTNYSLVTETLATTDGIATTYQKTLANTGIVAGTASVTDGTYSWNEVAGNPGSTSTATASTIAGFVYGATVTSGGSAYTDAPAVTISGNGSGATATATVSNGAVIAITITNAGSGYTSGATISIAPPPSLFRVTYSAGSIAATYATTPAAGQIISATYRYGSAGITGALAGTSQPWIAVSVNGTVQGTRQRVLAVPFAARAAVAVTALDAVDSEARQQIKEMLTSLGQGRSVELSKTIISEKNSSNGVIQASIYGYSGDRGLYAYQTAGSTFQISPAAGSSKKAKFFFVGVANSGQGSGYSQLSGDYEVKYTDGQSVTFTSGSGEVIIQNPNPQKDIEYFNGRLFQGWPQPVGIFTDDNSVITYAISNSPSVNRAAVFVNTVGDLLSKVNLKLTLQDGRIITTDPGVFVDLNSAIASIQVTARSPGITSKITSIKLQY